MGELIKKLKVGSILLSEWTNEAKVNGEILELPNITITRLYKDKYKKLESMDINLDLMI